MITVDPKKVKVKDNSFICFGRGLCVCVCVKRLVLGPSSYTQTH